MIQDFETVDFLPAIHRQRKERLIPAKPFGAKTISTIRLNP
jgi:hypothetical protein